MIPGIFLTMLEMEGDVKMEQKTKLLLCELQTQETLVKWSVLKSFAFTGFLQDVFPVVESPPVPWLKSPAERMGT